MTAPLNTRREPPYKLLGLVLALITVAMGLDRWWPTEGTRLTGERNKAQRQVVQGGRLVPLVPAADVPDWTFAAPLATYAMVELPFSETITLARHLQADTIRSLINRSALADIRDASTPPPTAVDGSGRSAQRFELVVRLVQPNATQALKWQQGMEQLFY